MAKKVLIAAIHHWHSPFQVGTHAIAKMFLKNGWEVAYISAPVTPFHFLREVDSDVKQRLQNHRAGGEYNFDGKLWHYVPFSLIAPDNKPIFSSKFFLTKWFHFSAPNLVKKIQTKKFSSPDLLFIDSYYQSFWLDEIRAERSAYRVADWNSGFKGFSLAAERTENRIIREVDRVFIAAESMRRAINEKHPKALDHLPNGVDLSRFIGPLPSEPKAYTHIKKPIVVYVGAFGDWFDFNLVQKAANCLIDVSFVLIGPRNKKVLKLSEITNIHYLGPIPSDQISAFLRHAQIGIIPFDTKNHSSLVNSINPLKLYEYLACNLSIVATSWDELERLEQPIDLAQDHEMFISLLKTHLEKKSENHLMPFNTELISWDRTTEVLFEWLNSTTMD